MTTKGKNVYIVDEDWSMECMFIDRGWEVVDEIDKAHLIQFTGGADINNELYGQSRHPRTYTSPGREEHELESFHYATTNSVPMGGICRGGQLINVLNGGSMFQDVNNHGRNHYMTDLCTSQLVFTTSVHHQMVKLSDKATLIAASQGISTRREWMDGVEIMVEKGVSIEPEAWYYPGAVCIQGHPEYDSKNGECRNYYFKLLKEFFNV